MTQSFYDQYSELINILDYIADTPEESTDQQKSGYFDLVKLHTKRALSKLGKNDDSSATIQAGD